MARIAVIGGTGPQGMGLALRLAQAGEALIIGSRQAARASEAAASIAARVPTAKVRGDSNEAVIRDADIAVLCLPFDGVRDFLAANGAALAGKIAIDVINPLVVKKGVFSLLPVPEGSAGQLVQQLAPAARVVGAFKTISAERLERLDTPMDGDVLLCGDDHAATNEVAALVRRIPNLRPIDTGGLANSGLIEGLTALLLNINRHYKTTTAVKIVGLE